VGRRLVVLGVFAAYFLCVLLLQRVTGAATASFGQQETDEPSHFLASVLIRDYLTSGLHERPIAYATSYYAHFPYFAIGYWPPAFYAMAALWMLVFGVSHGSALLLTATITAVIATLVFSVARRWGPAAVGFLWGALFLMTPEVVSASTMFMLDLPVTLFSFCALLALIRFSQNPDRVMNAVLFGGFATLTILTKYSGAFVCLLPIALIVATRRWKLFAKPTLWLQGAIVIAICGPWMFFTRRLMNVGLPSAPDPVHATLFSALQSFSALLVYDEGAAITVAAVLAIVILSLRRRWTPEVFLYVASPVCLIAFLLPTSVSNEPRYLLPAIPAVIALAAAGLSTGSRAKTPGARIASWAVPAILLAAGAATCAAQFPHYTPDRLTKLARYIAAQPHWRGNSILLPATVEGPTIAAIAIEDRSRPSYVLVRPGKVMGDGDWFGVARIGFHSREELQAALQRESVNTIIVDRQAPADSKLDALIRDAVDNHPAQWRRVAAIQPGWEIYQEPAMRQAAGGSSCFQLKTLSRLKNWNPEAQHVSNPDCPSEASTNPTVKP